MDLVKDPLKFDGHVYVMCIIAFRQINAMKRVSQYLKDKCHILLYKVILSYNFN